MRVRIYHNPRCSKSRRTLALLQEQDIDPEIINYLESPPDRRQLDEIINLLRISPGELVRKGQKEYRELGLDSKNVSDEELIDAMLTHPILIERPIVVRRDRARIGRPPESVLEIL